MEFEDLKPNLQDLVNKLEGTHTHQQNSLRASGVFPTRTETHIIEGIAIIFRTARHVDRVEIQFPGLRRPEQIRFPHGTTPGKRIRPTDKSVI